MQFNSSMTGRRRAVSLVRNSKGPVNGFPVVPGPTDAELLLQRARNAAYAEASQGRLGLGMALLQDALDMEPMSHDLLSDMAALLLAARQFDQAVAYAHRALQLISHHGPSLYTLGFSLAAQGQTGPAIEVLTRLTKGDPRTSLMAEAPELAPLVQVELQRLKDLAVD